MDVFSKIKGRISEYNIIVIGHLKWNPCFGEEEKAPPRGDPSTCTSTMIRGVDATGKKFVLLIDPTLRLSKEDYYFDINRRTGLKGSDVTHCFSTHSHFDHQIGLNYFPNATWYAAKQVAEELLESEFIDGSKVIGVTGEFLPGVYAIPLPGHTMTLHGVAFFCDGLKIIVASDAAMTKGHYANNTTMFEQSSKHATESIKLLKRTADIIIPGHDNIIINRFN